MTLVLALTAKAGVVMVADGQATAGDGPLPTRTEARKLGILHGRLIYGIAGDAGLKQRVVASIEHSVVPDDCGLPIDQLRPRLLAPVLKVQKEAADECVRISPLGTEPAMVQVLIAGVSDTGQPWIYEITHEGKEEVHHRAEAIGEGRPYARYALMSAEHYNLTSRALPHVRLFAYRAVDDAIRTAARSLGEPIMVLEASGSGATEVSKHELQGLATTVAAWQQQEQELFERLATRALHGPETVPPNALGVEPPDPAPQV